MADIKDLMLLMDVECADCGKLMALSHAYVHEHRYICEVCAEEIFKEIDEKYGLEFSDCNDS